MEVEKLFSNIMTVLCLYGVAVLALKPLSFGVDVNSYDENQQANSTVEDENGNKRETEDKEDEISDREEILDEEQTLSVATKRKSESQVPKLIDNKRKHLEKNLSAAQRNQLLLTEAKEDSKFRKDLAEAMRQSTTSFSSALDGINQSMMQIGNGLCRSLAGPSLER